MILVCGAVTGVILLGMTAASLYTAQRQLEEKGQAAFHRDVNAVMFHLRSQDIIDHTWIAQTESSGGLMLWIQQNGHPLLYQGPQENRTELVELTRQTALEEYGLSVNDPPKTTLQGEKAVFPLTDSTGEKYYGAAASIPKERGWVGVLMVKSLQEEQKQTASQRGIFLGLSAAALLLLFGFAWVFTTQAIRPAEESARKQREFISAASHELRAPLAVVRTCLPAVRNAPPDEAERFARMAEAECSRMARLVGDLLMLASADSMAWPVRWEETEPETLLLEAMESQEGRAIERGIRISLELPEDSLPKISCDSQRIGQVLTILLDNALEYAPKEGGKIQLSASLRRGAVLFQVADNGPGIPPEKRKAVFERFYRGDASRNKREHYGLGLCIAQEILTLHRSRMEISDAPGGGACFRFLLEARGPKQKQ